MSTLPRSIHTVTLFVWDELKKIAVAEGDEALRMMDYLDVTADVNNGLGCLLVQIEFKHQRIWTGRFRISQSDIERRSIMSDDTLRQTLSVEMRKQLSLVAQMHHARLDKIFPNAIKEVKLGYDTQKAQKLVIVVFKNGHVAEAPEHESKSDLFTARCSMLYDLPPR